MDIVAPFPLSRGRRLRRTSALRNLVRETEFNLTDCILPLFIKEGIDERQAIPSMPGHFQWSLYDLVEEIRDIKALGINTVLLFGIPINKDPIGSQGFAKEGVITRAIQIIKDVAPDMLVISDICCCEYTDHGHCGYIPPEDSYHDVHNDKTLELLGKQAESHAQAGVDIVAPSAKMDGQVYAIRAALDGAGFSHIPIMSYSAKYSSSFYGPFREASEGAPQFGTRRSYQMDPANGNEALKEVAGDIHQGADFIIIKPAMAYLDIIYRVKHNFPGVPIVAYQVSGEFAMIKAAAQMGWIEEQKSMLETLTGIKRAGADIIISYYTKELAQLLMRS